MTYQFIAQHQQEFPVQRMCQVLARLGKWLLRMEPAEAKSTGDGE
jgi:hypothetical protein